VSCVLSKDYFLESTAIIDWLISVTHRTYIHNICVCNESSHHDEERTLINELYEQFPVGQHLQMHAYSI